MGSMCVHFSACWTNTYTCHRLCAPSCTNHHHRTPTNKWLGLVGDRLEKGLLRIGQYPASNYCQVERYQAIVRGQCLASRRNGYTGLQSSWVHILNTSNLGRSCPSRPFRIRNVLHTALTSTPIPVLYRTHIDQSQKRSHFLGMCHGPNKRAGQILLGIVYIRAPSSRKHKCLTVGRCSSHHIHIGLRTMRPIGSGRLFL